MWFLSYGKIYIYGIDLLAVKCASNKIFKIKIINWVDGQINVGNLTVFKKGILLFQGC